jgi:hypothetical protein
LGGFDEKRCNKIYKARGSPDFYPRSPLPLAIPISGPLQLTGFFGQ